MSGRIIGKFRVHDAAGGMAHVATFHGEHFSGDRDGGDLKIYAHRDEHGMPVKRFSEEGTSGIRSSVGLNDARPDPRAPATDAENPAGPRTIADLQRIHDQHFAQRRGRPPRNVMA